MPAHAGLKVAVVCKCGKEQLMRPVSEKKKPGLSQMLLQLSSSTPLERNKVLEVLAAAADTCVRTDEETMYLELVHEQNKKCQITLRDRRPQAPLGVQIENEVDIYRTL